MKSVWLFYSNQTPSVRRQVYSDSQNATTAVINTSVAYSAQSSTEINIDRPNRRNPLINENENETKHSANNRAPNFFKSENKKNKQTETKRLTVTYYVILAIRKNQISNKKNCSGQMWKKNRTKVCIIKNLTQLNKKSKIEINNPSNLTCNSGDFEKLNFEKWVVVTFGHTHVKNKIGKHLHH